MGTHRIEEGEEEEEGRDSDSDNDTNSGSGSGSKAQLEAERRQKRQEALNAGRCRLHRRQAGRGRHPGPEQDPQAVKRITFDISTCPGSARRPARGCWD